MCEKIKIQLFTFERVWVARLWWRQWKVSQSSNLKIYLAHENEIFRKVLRNFPNISLAGFMTKKSSHRNCSQFFIFSSIYMSVWYFSSLHSIMQFSYFIHMYTWYFYLQNLIEKTFICWISSSSVITSRLFERIFQILISHESWDNKHHSY